MGVYGAGTPAHVQSIYGQLVTSSSLLWVRSGTGVSIPEDAVHSGTGKGVVCRGRHHGSDLVGVTDFGRCKVGFSNRLVSLNTFEVLTEVPGAVKLQWKPFTRFSAPPRGTVAGVDGEQPVYVARRLGEAGTMLPAVVEIPVASYGTGLIKVYTDHTVEDVKDGDVLVEVEPVRYRLVLDAFVKDPKQTRQRKILASSSIFRFLEGKEIIARMQKMLSYAYKSSEYYSHVAGTIKGLPVKVTLHSGETRNRLWGMKDRTEQSESMMVGHDMKQNSAVDVMVSCEEVEEVQQYTGTLVAVFPDGSERERRVEGTRVVRRLEDIREYDS